MNSDILILARLDNKRLPSKHLQLINDTPMILKLIKRLRMAKKIRKIIVCTTTDQSDDPLVEILESESILYFRGDANDIVKRLLDAANYFGTDLIVDVEGDKIYTDPLFVDKVVDELQNNQVDFVIGNDSPNEFNPFNHLIHGVIPAGIRKACLEKVYNSKITSNTETGYHEFFTQSDLISKKYIIIDELSEKNIRLTIDYPEDLELAKKIFQELGDYFHYYDILDLIKKNPMLLKITQKIIDEWKINYKKNVCDLSLKDIN